MWAKAFGLVCCSHSAIFQLKSHGKVVKLPNLDLLPGTQCHGQLGSYACRAYPDTETRSTEDVFFLLAVRGPTRDEGKPGIEPWSSDPQPACYFYSSKVGCELEEGKRKRKRSDSVLWQKPLKPTEMSSGQNDNTNNSTKKFDYRAVADRLRTVGWSNYDHPTGVVNLVYGCNLPTPRNSRATKRTHV